MKFRSNTGDALHIALTTGHTCVIPAATSEAPLGVEIEQRFHKKAIAAGAIPETVKPGEENRQDDEDDANRVASRTGAITEAIKRMLGREEKDEFKADGTPNLISLQREVGFKVSREEVEPIFKQLQDEAENA